MRARYLAAVVGVVALTYAIAHWSAVFRGANPDTQLSFWVSLGIPLFLILTVHFFAAVLVAGWNGVGALRRFVVAAIGTVASAGALNILVRLFAPLLEKLRDAGPQLASLEEPVLMFTWAALTVCCAWGLSRRLDLGEAHA